MLIVKSISYTDSSTQGAWYDFIVWGAVVGIKIRPRTSEVIDSIRERFKDIKDDTERIQKISDASLDFIIEDFRGIGEDGPDGSPIPWEANLANKKRLSALDMPPGVRPLYEQIYEKATGLGFEIIKEEQGN